MEFGEFILKFIFGGLIVTLISALSETEYRILSGLFVLFPAVTAVGYYFASQAMNTKELQDMAIFSLLSLPTLAIFFISFYVLIQYYSSLISILLSILMWLISSFIFIIINKYYLNLI